VITKARLVGSLATRLMLTQALKQEAPTFARALPPPIVIAGLQRTGTTLLHRLLASDPRLRSLRSYEALAPLSTSELSLFGRDPRWLKAKFSERALAYMAPDFFAIHPVEASAPEEDVLLLDGAFLSTVPEATLHVPSYARWLETQDHTPAYAYLALLLKWLSQRRGPTRWVLKTPHHLEYLDVLRKVFPGVSVIQTHRDPAQTLASFCSMVWHARGVFSDRVDAKEIGAHWSRKTQRMLARAMEVRAAAGDAGFVDLDYERMRRRPLEVIANLYPRLGLELSAEAALAMQRTLTREPQHKHGQHRYALADFGLSDSDVGRLFGPYRERFSRGESSSEN
jgi:hypothetical protein